MRYVAVNVNVDEKQESKLQKAIQYGTGTSLRVSLLEPKKDTVLLTKGQITRIDRARIEGKDAVSLKFSSVQVQKNKSHTGGFLWALASRLLPALLGGVASSLAAKATDKVVGRGVYFQKNGHCAQVQPVNGGGLYLSPHPKVSTGEGISDGGGLLLGSNSPFKNIPLLNILL